MRFALAFILLLLLSMPVFAQGNIIYTPADQSFTVEIPTDWVNSSTDTYGAFAKSSISAYWFVFDVETIEEAAQLAAEALEVTLPSLAQNSETPAPNGVWKQNLYISPEGTVDVAIGQIIDGRTYLLLMRSPDINSLSTINSDLTVMITTFKAASSLNLSGVTPQVLTEAEFAQLETYIAEAMDRFEVPGAAVAVVQNGEVVYQGAFGTADRTANKPVTDETSFMIGSVNKSMTTMMVASMIDEGLLTWDTPVSEIAPDFALSDAEVTAQLTVRDFFNMASGFPSYDVPLMVEHMTPLENITFMKDVPLVTPFRESYNYANQMYAAGGYYVAQVATGSTADNWSAYIDQINTRVFAPIGMTGSEVDFDAAISNPNHALPHYRSRTTGEIVSLPLDLERFVSSVYPAGAVWSNISDMSKYLITQMNDGIASDGTQVVSAETLAETRVPGVAANGVGRYAMGWMVSDYNGQTEIEHGGHAIGYTSSLGFLPESDLGVVILTNRESASLFAYAIRYYVYELAFGLEHTADKMMTDLDTAQRTASEQMQPFYSLPALPAEALAQYMGDYRHGIRLTEVDGVATIISDLGSTPITVAPDGSYIITAHALMLVVNVSEEGISFTLPNTFQTMTVKPLS